MYRNSKKKLAKRTSLSALMALGALATGAGIAGAATHSTTHSSTGAVGSVSVQPFSKHGHGTVDAPGIGDRKGGVITAVGGGSITVLSPSGTSSTFTIDATTKIFKDRAAATLSDLAVGERVGIQVSSTSATTAAAIEIQLAHIGGQVVSVTGNTITVADRDGFYRTVNVSASTTYTKGGAAASLSDITTGSFIMAEGTVDVNHTTLDATNVGIGTPTALNGGMGHGPDGMGHGPDGLGPQGMGPQGAGPMGAGN